MNNISKQLSVNINKPKLMFLVQDRAKITQIITNILKNCFIFKCFFTTRDLKICLSTLKSSFVKNLNSDVAHTFTKNAIQSMYAKQPTTIPLEFRKIERKIPLFDITSLNVVIQRIILIGTFLVHFVRLKI